MALLSELLLIGLASWRIANLLVNEDGPFDVFERLRLFVGLKPGPVSGFFPKLLTCIYCMSVWTTVVAYLAYLISPTIVMLIAAMSLALLVESHVNRS